MGTRSRMRKNVAYYHERKKEKLLRSFKPKGQITQLTELDVAWKNTRFPNTAEGHKVTGANKYCLYCQHKGERILNCRANWCPHHSDRIQIEEAP